MISFDLNIIFSYNYYMFFLSTPHAWHLAGTWSKQLPNNSNLIGMSQEALMMTLHSIFLPILIVICFYLANKVSKQEVKKVKG